MFIKTLCFIEEPAPSLFFKIKVKWVKVLIILTFFFTEYITFRLTREEAIIADTQATFFLRDLTKSEYSGDVYSI